MFVFPGAGTGDHEQRRGGRACTFRQAVLDGPPLFGVQLLQVGRGHSGDGSGKQAILIRDSCFVRNAPDDTVWSI